MLPDRRMKCPRSVATEAMAVARFSLFIGDQIKSAFGTSATHPSVFINPQAHWHVAARSIQAERLRLEALSNRVAQRIASQLASGHSCRVHEAIGGGSTEVTAIYEFARPEDVEKCDERVRGCLACGLCAYGIHRRQHQDVRGIKSCVILLTDVRRKAGRTSNVSSPSLARLAQHDVRRPPRVLWSQEICPCRA